MEVECIYCENDIFCFVSDSVHICWIECKGTGQL